MFRNFQPDSSFLKVTISDLFFLWRLSPCARFYFACRFSIKKIKIMKYTARK